MFCSIRVWIFTVISLLAIDSLLAENWPAWRGPFGTGVTSETKPPTSWDQTSNVAWKLALPGPAGSTPCVWKDHIFLTSVDGNELVLIAIHTDGKLLWKRSVGEGNKNVRGDEGNYASPSPVTDGTHVWAMMGNGAVGCYDFEGNQVWHLDLQERYGKFKIAFGMSSTPVLYEDYLYFQLIHGDGKAATQEALVACVEKKTGKGVWKQDRVTGAYNENEHSYASPMLYPFGKEPYLVTHGADYTIAYNLKDGTERWRLGGLNPQDDPKRKYHRTLRFVASPGVAEGLIVAPTAKNGPVFAIDANLSGDLTSNKQAHRWSIPRNTPDVPTPLIYEGLVYLCRENGNLLCLNAKTGEEIYHERTHRVRHRASPVCADGNIYLTGRDGKVTVVRAGKKFEIIAQNEIGEEMSASPAISNGTIYLRTFQSLWAIRNKD